MREVLIITHLTFLYSHIIVSFIRFVIVKDYTTIKDFVVIDLLGSYVVLLMAIGIAQLVVFTLTLKS